jgi:hypothetical protein
MTQPCSDIEPQQPPGPVDDGFDIDPDSGDGGDYDRALEAHDQQQAEPRR